MVYDGFHHLQPVKQVIKAISTHLPEGFIIMSEYEAVNHAERILMAISSFSLKCFIIFQNFRVFRLSLVSNI